MLSILKSSKSYFSNTILRQQANAIYIRCLGSKDAGFDEDKLESIFPEKVINSQKLMTPKGNWTGNLKVYLKDDATALDVVSKSMEFNGNQLVMERVVDAKTMQLFPHTHVESFSDDAVKALKKLDNVISITDSNSKKKKAKLVEFETSDDANMLWYTKKRRESKGLFVEIDGIEFVVERVVDAKCLRVLPHGRRHHTISCEDIKSSELFDNLINVTDTKSVNEKLLEFKSHTDLDKFWDRRFYGDLKDAEIDGVGFNVNMTGVRSRQFITKVENPARLTQKKHEAKKRMNNTAVRKRVISI